MINDRYYTHLSEENTAHGTSVHKHHIILGNPLLHLIEILVVQLFYCLFMSLYISVKNFVLLLRYHAYTALYMHAFLIKFSYDIVIKER